MNIDFRFMPDDWKSEHQDLVSPKEDDKLTKENKLMISVCNHRIEDLEKMRHIFGDEYTDKEISIWKKQLEELKGDMK